MHRHAPAAHLRSLACRPGAGFITTSRKQGRGERDAASASHKHLFVQHADAWVVPHVNAAQTHVLYHVSV